MGWWGQGERWGRRGCACTQSSGSLPKKVKLHLFFFQLSTFSLAGYDSRLIEMVVSAVPSMHVVINFLPEMLEKEKPALQVCCADVRGDGVAMRPQSTRPPPRLCPSLLPRGFPRPPAHCPLPAPFLSFLSPVCASSLRAS